jgi:hypothetical protein
MYALKTYINDLLLDTSTSRKGAINNGQFRDTVIGHTRHRTEINKTKTTQHTTPQKIKKVSNTDRTKPGVNPDAREG